MNSTSDALMTLDEYKQSLLTSIHIGITATNHDDAYSVGLRNGLRICKAYIDGQEPEYEEVKNDPLTWDELKIMKGKPVWVEIIGRTIPLDSSWGIATGGSYHTWQGVESWRLVRPGAEYSLPVAQYGKTWQAYRKERK